MKRIPLFIWNMILLMVIMLVIEPVQIYFFQRTYGKWLFGIGLSNKLGEKITFRDAFIRSGLVWLYGFAGWLPIIRIVSMLRTYQKLTDTGTTIWDKRYDFIVEHSKIKGWALLASILGNFIISAYIG